jgi:hypothetical protein
MKFLRLGTFLGTALALCLLSSQVQAHWCDDIWASAYNLVVRPESDTVTVPSSGSGSMVVYVQNNMSYLLPNFKLTATATGATITATRSGDKVSGTLLPGERGKYTLAITKSGGGTVNATDINFAVSFGVFTGQSGRYPSAGGKAAMIRSTSGSLTPTPPPTGLGQGGGQAADLNYSAVADYGTTSEGMDKLLQLYCAGRGSWSGGSFTNVKSNCPDTATTVCPTSTVGSGAGDKFMYPRLWAAGYMAIRKSALEGRAAVLRQRLQCGVNDANSCFAGFALMVLGYLGEDAGARTFIEGKISGTGDLATIAKAALVLMGNAADLTKYKADLTTGASASSVFVKSACMAALAIAGKDDAMANSLISLAKFTEPDIASDNGQGLYPSALLQIVAMDRRGWAAKAGDSGAVSFYGESGSSNPGTGGRVTGTGGGPGNGGAPGVGGATGGLGGRSGTGGGSTPPAGVGGSTRPSGTGGRGTTPAGTGGSGPGAGGGVVVGSGGSTTGVGGSVAAGGAASGGSVAAGGSAPPPSAGGSQAPGGEGGNDPTGEGGTTGPTSKPSSGGCNIGGSARTPALSLLAMGALAFLAIRRRRR